MITWPITIKHFMKNPSIKYSTIKHSTIKYSIIKNSTIKQSIQILISVATRPQIYTLNNYFLVANYYFKVIVFIFNFALLFLFCY